MKKIEIEELSQSGLKALLARIEATVLDSQKPEKVLRALAVQIMGRIR